MQEGRNTPLVSVRADEADDEVVDAFGPTTSEQLGLGPPGAFSAADRIGLFAERVDELRDRPLLIGIVLMAAIAGALLIPRAMAPDGPALVEADIPQVTLTPTSAVGSDVSATVIVHVSGAVREPGVFTLDASSRVIDAVEAAGGATGEADLDQLNLAAVVSDGQQIHVPLPGEPARTSVAAGDGPIDLNQADVVALQELPGVGPATAEAIVAHRDEHGPFRTVDDLLDVAGIGPAKMAAIAEVAVVR